MHSASLLLIAVVVALALVFDFSNGFHDTANAIAASVSTGVISPRRAVVLSGILNFAGALTGTAVAKTIISKIVDPTTVGQGLVIAALLAAIAWNLITWWSGIPSSSSHAILGGVVGATIASHGFAAVRIGGVTEIFLALVTSPIIGFVVAFFLMTAIYWIFRKARPAPVRAAFRPLEILASAWLSFSHGTSDAQKSMGIITMALIGYFTAGHVLPQWALPHNLDPHSLQLDFDVPLWVKAICALSMGFGTAAGGWRIIKTMGTKVVKLEPHNAFSVDVTSSMVISAFVNIPGLGLPVSTTHVVSGAVMGVGATKRMSAVRWGVAGNMLLAWILTIPITGAIAGLLYHLLLVLHLS
ncbi:MAG: inorganic phosphate transporter family protein [Cyanobacteria bacterium REEB65]|nr:inorganic phosphate transporter family protein [Cyanobacteria bacterium REEB65]